MLSLAYRIAAMSPLVDPEFNEVGHLSRLLIRESVRVKADNIYEFTNSQPQKLHIQDDIPNWMPPFEKCFIEFQFLMTDENDNNAICQAGAVISRTVRPDKADVPPDAKHLVSGLMWTAISGKHPLAGRPISLGVFIVAIDGKGRAVSANLNAAQADLNDLNFKIMCVSGLTFSFMHCKNVRQIEAKDDAGQRFHDQYKIPRFKYRTLVIDPMKEALRREGRSDTEGLRRALHICRGHFSTYSEEKPLFGKYPGTFYIPDHVRGSKEHGEVQKDYVVK